MASWQSGARCLLCASFVLITYLQHFVSGEPQVPCYFIFGDSFVDSGNNNDLNTSIKANYPPYGIDFPGGCPTGRFCNGRTSADIIGEFLGMKEFIPPFRTAYGPEILRGVNYASGSAGILVETGKHLGENIELNRQLRNHQATVSRIEELLGSKDNATNHLKQCLYLINIGSNDYLNNYFVPEYYNSSMLYTPEQFTQVLVQNYSQQIMTLYNSGASKVAVSGLLPGGCFPYYIQNYGTNGSLCVDYINQAESYFNEYLKLLVNQMTANLPDAEFVYLETIELPHSPPTLIQLTGCCAVMENGLCVAFAEPCPARILFWDSFHPTEAINRIIALISYLDVKKIL